MAEQESELESEVLSESLVTAIRDFLALGEDNEIGLDPKRKESLETVLGGVRQLITGLSERDRQKVEASLDVLGAEMSSDLFGEVGRLTRRLHSSLVDFRYQLAPKLERIVKDGVPQATDQLESVIQMTDQAAHKVLELVEQQSALLFQQKKTAKSLDEGLSKYSDDPQSFPFAKIRELSDTLSDQNRKIQGLNGEILMAQEFQDLSGQILKKVILLITNVEESLVELVRMFGMPAEVAEAEAKVEAAAVVAEEQAPAASCDQDQIDDLLGSLGF